LTKRDGSLQRIFLVSLNVMRRSVRIASMGIAGIPAYLGLVGSDPKLLATFQSLRRTHYHKDSIPASVTGVRNKIGRCNLHAPKHGRPAPPSFVCRLGLKSHQILVRRGLSPQSEHAMDQWAGIRRRYPIEKQRCLPPAFFINRDKLVFFRCLPPPIRIPGLRNGS
jgi:hypothetical protein